MKTPQPPPSTTIDECTQCAAPMNCSMVRNGKHAGKCGLQTLSATHIGAIGAIIFAIAEPGLKAGKEFIYNPSGKLSPDILPTMFWICFGLTAIYYIFAEWRTEDRDYITYRSIAFRTPWLQRLDGIPFCGLKWIELYLRVILTCAFGLVFLLSHFTPSGWETIDFQMLGLAGIYWLFLLWDWLIIDFGGKKLSWPLVSLDVIGFLLILACLWFHAHNGLTFGLVLIYFTITAVTLAFMIAKYPTKWWSDRQSYR